MKIQVNNRHLIVGGPGSGKTTLVNAMGKIGFNTMDEAAYRIVDKNLKNGSNNLPWGNRHAFDAEVFILMLNDYFDENRSKPTFYDGGLLDILAWEAFLGFDSKLFVKFAKMYRYEKTVFILEPWEDIYLRNNIRNFSFSDSQRVFYSIKKYYFDFNYDIVLIKKNTSIDERKNIILRHL